RRVGPGRATAHGVCLQRLAALVRGAWFDILADERGLSPLDKERDNSDASRPCQDKLTRPAVTGWTGRGRIGFRFGHASGIFDKRLQCRRLRKWKPGHRRL